MSKEEEDITKKLLDEEKELKKQVEKKQQELDKITKPKQKGETIASETPQDRFRRIIRDQGYSTGIENLTSVFFEGDTDSPSWLNEVLKLSHIPSKNREIILTAYYGKPISELGVSIDVAGTKKDEKKDEKKKEDELEVDILKISEEEMKQRVTHEKTRLALAQLKNMREELEGKSERNKQQQAPQSVQMRQISRPLVKDGNVMKDGTGNIIYETIYEPSSQTSGGMDVFSMIAAMKALSTNENKTSPEIAALAESIRLMSTRLDELQKNREIESKEREIQRLRDKQEETEKDYKRDIEKKEQDFRDRLDTLNKERVRDLEQIEKRFTETIQHKKELDDVIGQISTSHKKEIDEMKKRLEHAQTSIERTVVAKGTDTVDKLSGKIADTVDGVIKPVVSTMKDHYTLIIDQQRRAAGLPDLKSSMPQVDEDELRKFAGGE